MIVTELLGNMHDEGGAALTGQRHIERVELADEELSKRIQRVRTDHGHEIGLRLPSGTSALRDGDILLLEGTPESGSAVVVSLLPTDVLVISAGSIAEMAFLAHSLGNRHLPAQFFDAASAYGAEVMVVRYDHTVEDFLLHHGARYERQERVMPVPFRHAEHTH